MIGDDRDIILTLIAQYKKYYHINQTSVNDSIFYFRSINDISLLVSSFFDVANFVVNVVNSCSLNYKEKKEKKNKINKPYKPKK